MCVYVVHPPRLPAADRCRHRHAAAAARHPDGAQHRVRDARRDHHRVRAGHDRRADLHHPHPAVHHAGHLLGRDAVADPASGSWPSTRSSRSSSATGAVVAGRMPPGGSLFQAIGWAIIIFAIGARAFLSHERSVRDAAVSTNGVLPAVEVDNVSASYRVQGQRVLARVERPRAAAPRRGPAAHRVRAAQHLVRRPEGQRARRHRPQRRRQVDAACARSPASSPRPRAGSPCAAASRRCCRWASASTRR